MWVLENQFIVQLQQSIVPLIKSESKWLKSAPDIQTVLGILDKKTVPQREPVFHNDSIMVLLNQILSGKLK